MVAHWKLQAALALAGQFWIGHSTRKRRLETPRPCRQPALHEIEPEQVAACWRFVPALLVAALVFQKPIGERAPSPFAARNHVVVGGRVRVMARQAPAAWQECAAACSENVRPERAAAAAMLNTMAAPRLNDRGMSGFPDARGSPCASSPTSACSRWAPARRTGR